MAGHRHAAKLKEVGGELLELMREPEAARGNRTRLCGNDTRGRAGAVVQRRAFGGGTTFVTVTVVTMVGGTLASARPPRRCRRGGNRADRRPGGVRCARAIGVPSVLLYRVLTCWLPVFVGWPIMRWLTAKDMIWSVLLAPVTSKAPWHDLTGHVALVTSGNGGIGLGMARGLAAGRGDGRDLGHQRRQNRRGVGTPGRTAAMNGGVALVVDVGDETAVNRAVTETSRFGRIDSCFANAGVPGPASTAIDTMTTQRVAPGDGRQPRRAVLHRAGGGRHG